jgi:hypothetical protein
MAKPDQPLPAGGESREEIAKREVGHTTIAPLTVRVLVVFFLAAIAAVPILEWRGVRGLISSHLMADTATDDRRPELQLGRDTQVGRLWDRIVSVNRIVQARLNAFERGLEDDARIGRLLRPRAQVVMTRWLGAGNERVYRGRVGWLFYRPDVEYVTGRPFLAGSQIDRRIGGTAEWDQPPQPDPRRAIVQFKRDLEARKIALIVMPTPVKPAVHPEMLAERYTTNTIVLQNPSYHAFVGDLARDGVLVFDPSDALAAERAAGQLYLATDTHWRPEAMEVVAERLADFIGTHVRLPAATDPAYRVERSEVRNAGDAARMLDLPDDSPMYPPEPVWLRRVLLPDGSLWRSTRDADVLVLGDSFSNIYTLESMGWGTSAGLVEQLSYALRRPVDRLIQNDEGAFATRALLQQEPDRLDGKRVVIYQFAARELAFGDWRVIPLRAE